MFGDITCSNAAVLHHAGTSDLRSCLGLNWCRGEPIPVRPPPDLPPMTRARSSPMCHVLIIEDNMSIADYVGELATEAGATSLAFAATEKAAVASALAARPALILSDVRLFEGTGPRAVQSIIAALGAIPVIFITGSPDECDPVDQNMMVFTKPFRGEMVIAAARQLVGGRERDGLIAAA